MRSIGAPVLGPDGGVRAGIAVVFVDDGADTGRIGRAVAGAAARVAAGLR
jgi:DNA-binding IclR family transcriptional regulator